ncbi:hypothetical protein GCM10023353_16740 [Tomitella cavernea]|uniref:Uncharacterized protein n=1 Tax=Tomitella cavernea TaxID=1387982 RepID=A0ABP9CK56_9ACTN
MPVQAIVSAQSGRYLILFRGAARRGSGGQRAKAPRTGVVHARAGSVVAEAASSRE